MKKQIYDSWNENALEWIRVIEDSALSSRKITSPAIVNAVVDSGSKKIMDAGCGEGWLCRTLATRGLELTGIDANERLLEQAISKGMATYAKISFEEILEKRTLPDSPYDCIVFNFSLYLELETLQLLAKLKKEITPNGFIIIQTIHPSFLFQNSLSYNNQWISDSWRGLNGSFKNGHPYFIRTFSGWIQTINEAGLKLNEVREPLDELGPPLSLILILSLAD